MSNKRKNKDLSARRRRMIEKGVPWGYVLPVVVIIIIIGGLATYLYLQSMGPTTPPIDVAAFPFPCASQTATLVTHMHPYLRIVIEGTNFTIPADIGIVNGGTCLEPMHTHDSSGIIHIETANGSQIFTLGDFFQIWNVTDRGVYNFSGTSHPIIFNQTDILGYKVDATHKVILLVDGVNSTEYGSLVLTNLDYCSASTTTPPCSPSAIGNPTINGISSTNTGHTVVIEYNATS